MPRFECPAAQGLGITTGKVIGGVMQTPLILNMFDQKIISVPAFTVVLTEQNPVKFAPDPAGEGPLRCTLKSDKV